MQTKNPNPQSYPWMVPAPVKKGRFESLHAQHQQFNVEVDLAAIRPYSNCRRENKKVLWSDLQNPWPFGHHGRLGSGRSGVYRSCYLKGVGRTTLAANWNAVGDPYHSSGHLLPSGAVREYLVSVYFRSLGLEHSIVPCEGILFASLDKNLRHHLERTFGVHPSMRTNEIDRRFQSITVKPHNFLRFSNLNWWLSHVSVFPESSMGIVAFVQKIFQNLTDLHGSNISYSPEGFLRIFEQTFEGAFRSFTNFFRAGVCWGSFNNNCTLDGRFLDLEVASLVGPLFFGFLSEKKVKRFALDRDDLDIVTGTEVKFYADEAAYFAKLFFNALDTTFERLPKHQRDFFSDLRELWKKNILRQDFWINSREALKAKLSSWLASELNLDKVETRAVNSIIALSLLKKSRKTTPVSPFLRLDDCRGIPVEPFFEKTPYYPKFKPPSPDQIETTKFFRDIFFHLNTITDSDQLFEHLSDAARAVSETFAPARIAA